MRNLILAAAALAMLSTPAWADDALIAQGQKDFEGVCAKCHRIEGPDGIIGKSKIKTGPNMYGLPGRKAGSVETFSRSSGKTKYGKSLVAAGEKGLVWDAEQLEKFVRDPKGYLKDYLGEKRVKVKMAKQKKGDIAAIYAYLESISK